MNNSVTPALSELLSPSAIKLNLAGTDRDAILGELVEQVPALAALPDARQTLLRALHEREQLHSTGIGDGVALPHARNALVGLVSDPVLVFGRHQKGVPYGAIDGVPAKLFFLVVAPTVTQHLGLLARLSRLLRDAKFRKALLLAETSKKVQQVFAEAETKL